MEIPSVDDLVAAAQAAPLPQETKPPVDEPGVIPSVDELVAAAGRDETRMSKQWTAEDLGFPDLTQEQMDSAMARRRKKRTFLEGLTAFDKTDVPLAGPGAELGEGLRRVQLDVKKMTGTLTPEQQFELFAMEMEDERESARLAGIPTGDIGAGVKESMVLGSEIGLGAITGGLGSGAIAGRLGTKFALDAARKRALSEAARYLGTAAATAGLREGVPRLRGDEGGGASVRSLRRVIPHIMEELSDEEALALATLAEKDFAERFLPMVYERNSLLRGLAEEFISAGVETAGGVLLGKMGEKVGLQSMQMRLWQKLADGETPQGFLKKLANATAVDIGATEVGEEFLEGMAVEGLFGDGPMSGLPQTFDELATILGVAYLPAGAAAVVERQHIAARAKAQEEARQGVENALEGEGTETSTGGETSPAASTNAETASESAAGSVEPESVDVTDEMRAQDASDFTESVRGQNAAAPEFTASDPADFSNEDLATQRFYRRNNVEATFVDAPEGADLTGLPLGEYLGDGRVVIVRDTPFTHQVAAHETMHQWWEQQPEEKRAALEAELNEIDSEFLKLAGDSWAQRTTLDLSKVSPELKREEALTTGAEQLAGLIDYLQTPQGVQDFEAVYEANPGRFQRVLDAVWDFVASRVAMLPRGKRAKAQARLDAARGRGRESTIPLAKTIANAMSDIEPVMRMAPTAEDVAEAEAAAPKAQRPAASVPKKTSTRKKKARGGKRAAAKREQEKQARSARARRRSADGTPDGMTGRGEVADLSGVDALQSPEFAPRTDDGSVARRKADKRFATGPRSPEGSSVELGQRLLRRYAKKGPDTWRRHYTSTGTFARDYGREPVLDVEVEIRKFDGGYEAVAIDGGAQITLGDGDTAWQAAIVAEGALRREEAAREAQERAENEDEDGPLFAPAPPVESDAFRKWFRDSKVVDENGAPLVVYHAGTFDETEDGVPEIGPDGMHFGTKMAAEARDAAKLTDDMIRGAVVEEYENDDGETRWGWTSPDELLDSYDETPEGFDTAAEARSNMEATALLLTDNAYDHDPLPLTAVYLRITNPKRVPDQKVDWREAIESARSEGHDGLVYRNQFEDRGSTSYVIFEPTQAKSVQNQGTFDPSNPDIRYAVPAWHGTPHSFDKFDTSAIGSGEGAQAYGWGLYFADRRAVAEWYRDNLAAAPAKWSYAGTDAERLAVVVPILSPTHTWPKRDESDPGWLEPVTAVLRYIDTVAGGVTRDEVASRRESLQYELDDAVAAAGEELEEDPMESGWEHYRAELAELDAALALFDAGLIDDGADGSLYRVTLAPNEDEFLLWDKPLSGQSEKVKAALGRWDIPGLFRARAGAGGVEVTGARGGPVLRTRPATPTRAELRDIFWGVSGRDFYEQLVGGRDAKESSQFLLRSGIRGIKYLDGSSRRKGEGDYNYVIFDDADVTIDERFAAPIDPEVQSELEAAGYAAPNRVTQSFTDAAVISSTTDKFLRKVSDADLVVPKWLRGMREQGYDLDETHMPEEVLRLRPGREAHLTRELQKRHRKVVKMMVRHKIDIGDKGDTIADGKANIGEYAYLRHVPEANQRFADQYREKVEKQAEVAALKKELKDVPRDGQAEATLRTLEKSLKDQYGHLPRVPRGADIDQFFHETRPLSGEATSEAQALLEQYDALSQADVFRRVGEMHDDLVRETRDYQLEAGLISAETHADWARFDHYAPLRTAEVNGPSFSMSRGLGVRGPEAKRRKGRASRPDNPFVMQYEQALNAYRRGEKNRVGQEFRNFLLANRHVLDVLERDNVERKKDDSGWDLSPTEFHIKVNGRDVAIDLQNEDMARALQRTHVASVPAAVRHLFVNPMNLFRAAVTQYSPDFIFRNLFRDFGTAQVNALELGEEFDLEGLNRDIAKNMPSAIRTGYRYRRGKSAATELAPLYEEYLENGGEMGLWGSPEFEQQLKSFRRGGLIEGTWGLKSAAAVGRWVGDTNTAIEHAARFSAYVALRNRGVDVRRAAREAKRLTVDFSQRGEWGAAMSTIWAFFSASVGGTRRGLEALRRSSRARKVMGAIVANGILQSVLMEMISDVDDEDGLSYYSKLPDYLKETNLVLWMHGDDPVMVPMPYFYGWFHNFGRILGDGMQGKVGTRDALSSLGRSALTNFSPIGSVVPTLAQPFTQIATNEAFHGGPIRPEYADNPYGPEVAKWARSGPKATWAGKTVARGLNKITGGFGDNASDPGLINLAGDDVDHIFEFFFGGPARTATNVERSIKQWMSPQADAEPANVPVLRVFFGAKTEFTDRSHFYDAMDDIYRDKESIDHLRENGNEEAARRKERQLAPILALEKSGRSAGKRSSALRKKAYAAEGVPDQELLDQADNIMKRWYKRYLMTTARLKD